jgi:hypothetical protein
MLRIAVAYTRFTKDVDHGQVAYYADFSRTQAGWLTAVEVKQFCVFACRGSDMCASFFHV